MYASTSEVLKASDVAVEQSKIYSYYSIANLIFYVFEILIVISLDKKISPSGGGGNIFEKSSFQNSPLYVSKFFSSFGWIGCLVFQGIFAFRVLFKKNDSTHYKNCLLLKIKFYFVIMCIFYSIFFILCSTF